MSEQQGLAQLIEDASLASWPALEEEVYDGWLLRFSRGFTKRANSINPFADSQLPLREKVAHCEQRYQQHRLHTVFRLTSIHPAEELVHFLAQRAYHQLDASLVLTCTPSPQATIRLPANVEFQLLDAHAWLQVYAQLNAMPPLAQQLHGAILAALTGQCAFAILRVDGHPAACGLAVTHQQATGFFDIVTHTDYRRQGLGRLLVQHLQSWAAHNHSEHIYLQVLQSNAPAVKLYRQLGFRDCYSYCYLAQSAHLAS